MLKFLKSQMPLCYTWGPVFVNLCTSVVRFLCESQKAPMNCFSPCSWNNYSHFTRGKAESEELTKVTRGEVKLKAECRSECNLCLFSVVANSRSRTVLPLWALPGVPFLPLPFPTSNVLLVCYRNAYFSPAKDILIRVGFVRKEAGGLNQILVKCVELLG